MEKIKLPFNSIFKEFNQCTKRYRVAKGSAGSGKSVNVAQEYVLKLSDMKYKGANLLCVRKVAESNKDSTFAELVQAIYKVYGNKVENFWQIRENPLYIQNRITGNSVLFRGMNDDKQREKVKSINVKDGDITWVWIEEATELTEDDIEIIDDRLRGMLSNPHLYYQITFTFNPVSATHWIKKKYFDIPDDDVYLHHSTYLNNRFIDEAFKKRQDKRKIYDPEGYRVYGLGDWGELGGLILNNVEIRDLKELQFKNFDNKGYAQDFGFNHANVILSIAEKDNCLYVFNEIYVYEKDTNEILDLCKQHGLDKRLPMVCDSAEPDRIKMFKKEGYRAFGVKKKQGSVKAQIDTLKSYDKIYIDSSCVNTYKESQQWKWKKDKDNNYIDEPVTFFDDAMACLRYSSDLFNKSEWGWKGV